MPIAIFTGHKVRIMAGDDYQAGRAWENALTTAGKVLYGAAAMSHSGQLTWARTREEETSRRPNARPT